VNYVIVFLRGHRVPSLRSLGEWAVVTGATDGIGRAMAMELAKKGFSIFLVSRSEERLRDCEKEMKAIPGFKSSTKTLAIDFSRPEEGKIYERLEAEVKGLDVGILVNNVGLAYPSAQYFSELPAQFIDDLINVNVRSVLRTTHIVYGGMSERKRGAIVCVGSGASVLPTDPLYAAYAATKGAAEAFCRSLQVESRSKKIIVQCHVPLLVATKLSKIRQSSLTVPNPSEYAKAAVLAIENGNTFGTSTICPYWIHNLMLATITNVVPLEIWNSFRFSQTQSIRKKYMSKIQSEAKTK